MQAGRAAASADASGPGSGEHVRWHREREGERVEDLAAGPRAPAAGDFGHAR